MRERRQGGKWCLKFATIDDGFVIAVCFDGVDSITISMFEY